MAWSPFVELVTLEQAKQALKLSLDLDADDDDMQLRLMIAHEQVMDYVLQRVSDLDAWIVTVNGWTSVTAPRRVLGAILEQFAFLCRYRGDEQAPAREKGSALCIGAEAMLYRLRDPALS